MTDFWAVENSGIWSTESGGGWLIEIQVPIGSCELVSLDTVKARLGITDTTHDVFLQAQIAYISQAIMTYCHRRFCAGDYTQTWNRPIDTGLVWGTNGLYLAVYPVNSIASVTVNGNVLNSDQYSINKSTGFVVSTKFMVGHTIEIAFNAGFNPIPADLAMAAEDITVSRYLNRSGDPTKVIRSESVPEVGSVDYVASTYQRGMSTIFGPHQETIDWYRSEGHFEYDASL